MQAPKQDLRAAFKSELLRAFASLRSNRTRIHIPPAGGLNHRRPESHFHATPELFIQTGGGTDFDCPGGRFRLATGDLCIMPSGVPHAETPVDLRTRYKILVCMRSREGLFLQWARADARRRIQAAGTIHLASARMRDIFRYLDDIAAHHTIPAAYQKVYIQALLEAFLLAVLGELQHSLAIETAAGSPLVVEAEKLVRTRLADSKLTVAGLAGTLGCSSDHLTRIFRWERGLGLKRWIARERITMALDLLAVGRHNVAEVGWACGFNEPSYFIRVFRHLTGFTPLTFRLKLNSKTQFNSSPWKA